MGLVSALFTGVSGLTTNSQSLSVIGDNISNVNTVGFKGSKTAFGDVLSSLLNNGGLTAQIGRGSQLRGVIQSFSQGSFESSDNALDLALDGGGFFIVNNGEGNFYTRAGQFRINDDGLVASPTGEILQGFQITQGTVSASLSDVDLAGAQSAPAATTEFTLGANLDASASAGTTFTAPVSLFNSVGTEVVLSLTFTKGTGNVWTYAAIPSDGTVTAGVSGTVTFDTTGQLSAVNGGSVADVTITIDYSASNPPANTQDLVWNLAATAGGTNGKLTGFSAASNNNSVVQDGYTTGVLTGIVVGTDGIISGLFNNGQSQDLFQVALANFLSPTGLNRRGQNLFAQTAASGQPVIGTAETGSFGSVLGNTLELSNVDLANEFVTMIQTQQAFQAAARVITTTDDLLTEAVNLVR